MLQAQARRIAEESLIPNLAQLLKTIHLIQESPMSLTSTQKAKPVGIKSSIQAITAKRSLLYHDLKVTL